MTTFWVAGRPVQQGGVKAFNVGGKARVVNQNPVGLQAWRGAIAEEARRHFTTTTIGPVSIEAAFVLPRPKSHPKTRERPHISAPDSDKLARSCLDAMTGWVYGDDRQVNDLRVTKRYARFEEQPGVMITVIIDG